MSEPISVLFVCLGNICRSPTAEGIFRHLVDEAGLADRFVVDSAGTGSWHVGAPPDPRMTRAAATAGYRLLGTARQVEPADYSRFRYILAMDRSNLETLRGRAPPRISARLELFRAYDPLGRGEDVPDPYYGGEQGFRHVVEMVERTSRSLIQALTEDR